jgi:hypothetical protein
MFAAGVAAIGNTAWHWMRFDSEVGAFDEALAHVVPNRRVVALIYDPRSLASRFSPFLHFGSYYQLEKGGVVQFTFAGYDQWPLDFKPGRYPLYDGPATPHSEYAAAIVATTQPLDSYFDYALVRDLGSDEPPPGFRLAWSGDRWQVYERAPTSARPGPGEAGE